MVNKKFRNLRLDQYRRFFGINRNFQIVSASEGEGCSELVDMALNFLPEGPKPLWRRDYLRPTIR